MPISKFLAGTDSEVGQSVPKNLKVPTIQQVNDRKVQYSNTTLRSIRVHGKVDLHPVKWLIDTGATCTVISDAIPIQKEKIRPVMSKPKGACGMELNL